MAQRKAKPAKPRGRTCPERARVFLAAEPARAHTCKPVADIQLVIQVTEADAPVREWLSSTKRLTDRERAALKRAFDKLVGSVIASEYGDK